MTCLLILVYAFQATGICIYYTNDTRIERQKNIGLSNQADI